MRSRLLSSAVFPAIALPALFISPAHHTPALPGFGVTRAVHFVTSTVGSVTSGSPAGHRSVSVVTTRAARPHQFVVLNCANRGVIRPRSFQLACADGNDYLGRLRWQAWGQGYATATGTQTMNDCQPSCAQGRFHSYPIRVIFWGGEAVASHPGEQRYTMVTLLYTGQEPSMPEGSATVPGPPSVTGNLWN